MECPRCHGALPEVAHFCHHCGHDIVSRDVGRRKSYAAQPNQPVASFAPVSTIMPRGSVGHPGTYQVALVATLLIMVVTAALGAVPLALAVAAFAIPIVYIVYIYDVNLWEDQPILVTVVAFLLTFGLSVGWTLIWNSLQGSSPMVALPGIAQPFHLRGFLVMVLVAPVIGEVVRQLGPVLLASRKEFDDLMDGFTFGVIAGVGYAAAETLVLYWSMLKIGFAGAGGIDSLQMIVLLLLHGFVKPLLYGTASGIAAAEFSGLGKGYDGFTGRYLRGIGLAVAAVALFNAGLFVSGQLANSGVSVILALIWAVALLAALTLAARNVLHAGLLEAALESAARGGGIGADGELHFCANCEMPLLAESSFCSACGLGLGAVQRIPVGVGAVHEQAPTTQPAGVPPSAEAPPAGAAEVAQTTTEEEQR